MGGRGEGGGIRVWVGGALALLLGLVAWVISHFWMPGPDHGASLPPASEPQQRSARRLRQHVEMLAGSIGERRVGRASRLHAAAAYIEQQWQGQGLQVERACLDAGGVATCNLIVTVGEGEGAPEVVGAHYDSAAGTPGADDNASGVAVLMELSRALKGAPPARRVRFVAYTNEEPPWFRTDRMGSALDARKLAERNDAPLVMFSLEMLGFYTDAPDSQQYPVSWLGWLYGDRGNYVAFVGNMDSVAAVRDAVSAFRHAVVFPARGTALPEAIPGVDFSDQLNYWAQGWPAVMVTDTSFNRNPNYHEPTDTPDTLDYDRMSRVVEGLVAVVQVAGAAP